MGFAQPGKISLFFKGGQAMVRPQKHCIIASMKRYTLGLLWVTIGFIGLTACGSTKVVKGTTRTLENGSNTSKYPTSATTNKTDYTRRLGIDLPPDADPKLMMTIADWMGTPYRMGGAAKNGVDCSGFIQEVYKTVYQKPTPRTTNQLFIDAESVSRRKLKEGDLVFFKINSIKVGHAGIYLFDDYFAHASTSRGVMISKLTDIYWSKYFTGGGRF